MRNPFDTALAARQYAKGRPYYHELVARLIREKTDLAWPVDFALDVGCGTGQSARALAGLARVVLGVDSSPAMIAERGAGPRFALSRAEALPVRDASVSLLTRAAAFHWFEPRAFLSELRRALRPEGVAVLYDNFFLVAQRERDDFGAWYRGPFIERFPRPPRHPAFAPSMAAGAGLSVDGPQTYQNDVAFELEGLVSYLMTQSNVQANLTADAEAWLTAYLGRFFEGARPGTFAFGGEIWYLRRA